MALANCDECGKELSEHAEVCPHCAASAKVALRTFEQERRKKVIIDHAVIEGEIRKALSKPEGDLTKGDLEQLTSLTLSDTPITDLTPLKDLTQLTSLYFFNTGITDLTPLKDLTQITSLKLHYNQITDLTPLKDLTQLTSLSFSHTPITDLTPLKDLTQLTYLKLSNNPRLDQEEIDDLWTMLSCSSESLFDIEIDSDYPDAGPKPKPWWKFW